MQGRLAELAHGSALDGQLESLRGRVVPVATHQQFTAALALIELDGVARRVVLHSPDLDAGHLSGGDSGSRSRCLRARCRPALQRGPVSRHRWHQTEWILPTSGTSGAPKLVLHTLASLTSAFAHQPRPAETVLWSTFYDIRRYGGLQILLRALHDGAMVLSSAGESIPDFLARAALMSGAATRIAPKSP